tara:strand:- start:216 stop:440 length:225 start_codon:yes stop_codon:yes gene_type:complete
MYQQAGMFFLSYHIASNAKGQFFQALCFVFGRAKIYIFIRIPSRVLINNLSESDISSFPPVHTRSQLKVGLMQH